MKPSSAFKLKTGLFITAGLALLFIFIFVIGSQKNMFSKSSRLHGVFKNVAGLKEGAFVRFAGINVGTVDGISIVNDTSVKVDFSIENKVRQFIRSDSKISIGSDGLMGDKLITLSAGTDSGTAVKEGQQLQTYAPLDMEKMMARANSMTESADKLINNLADITGRINNGEGSIGRLLKSDKLVKNMENTLATAETTVETANRAAANVADNMERVKNSFLFKGYFKKKERRRIKDSTAAAEKKLKKSAPKVKSDSSAKKEDD